MSKIYLCTLIKMVKYDDDAVHSPFMTSPIKLCLRLLFALKCQASAHA